MVIPMRASPSIGGRTPIRNAWFVDLIRAPVRARGIDLERVTPGGARNGFAEPRDWKPKSTLSRSHPAPETGPPALERAEIPAN
jgi:hypothetical protein